MGCNVGSGGLAALTNSGSPSRLWQAAECPTGSQAAKPTFRPTHSYLIFAKTKIKDKDKTTSRPTHPYLTSAKTKIKYGQRQNMIKYKTSTKTKTETLIHIIHNDGTIINLTVLIKYFCRRTCAGSLTRVRAVRCQPQP